MHKIVHLDLNGMCPPVCKLIELISIFAKAGYDGLMIGWEDKFPWSQKEFRSERAFSPDDITVIQKTALDNGLFFIPMIQCLGHMENFLYPERYAHLREIPNRNDCLNPLAPGALEFVMDLLEEMLALSPDIKFIHIGGDEVWTLGMHPDTKAFIERHSKAELYLKHVIPILDMLNERGIKPMLWHDMLIKWDREHLLSIKDRADIVFWGYELPVYEVSDKYHYNIQNIRYFAKLGLNLWGAGAYKGGSGPDSIMPDKQALMNNAQSWYRAAHEFGFKGLIATGWSRYSQFHPPCDPVFLSLDSLFIVSAIFEGNDNKSQALFKMREVLMECGIFEQVEELKTVASEFIRERDVAWACVRNLSQQYEMERKFLQGKNSHISKIMLETLQQQIRKLEQVGARFKKLLSGLTYREQISEFIDTKIDAIKSFVDNKSED